MSIPLGKIALGTYCRERTSRRISKCRRKLLTFPIAVLRTQKRRIADDDLELFSFFLHIFTIRLGGITRADRSLLMVDRAEKYRSENGPGPAGGPGATSERTGAALPECPQRQKIRFDKSRITYKSE